MFNVAYELPQPMGKTEYSSTAKNRTNFVSQVRRKKTFTLECVFPPEKVYGSLSLMPMSTLIKGDNFKILWLLVSFPWRRIDLLLHPKEANTSFYKYPYCKGKVWHVKRCIIRYFHIIILSYLFVFKNVYFYSIRVYYYCIFLYLYSISVHFYCIFSIYILYFIVCIL